jgi:hypothetical protein
VTRRAQLRAPAARPPDVPRRPLPLPALLLALTGALAPLPSAAATAASQPVLGSPSHLAPAAQGYGKVAPRHVYNGGDPSGEVARLGWRHWGAATATGRGVTWLLRPEGGYYARPGRIVLRAEALGTCPDGTAAYTRLEFRIADHPGGPVGHRWRLWSGDGDIC